MSVHMYVYVYVHVHIHTDCQCRMSMPYVHAACPCNMSMPHVHAHGHAACPCHMSMIQNHATWYCFNPLTIFCPAMSVNNQSSHICEPFQYLQNNTHTPSSLPHESIQPVFCRRKTCATAADSPNESNDDDTKACLGFLVYLFAAPTPPPMNLISAV